MRSLIAFSLLSGFCFAPQFVRPAIPQENPSVAVTVVARDPSGAPLKNELVIVQDLDHSQAEMARALTNENGEIPPLSLHPGVYRAIATAPYTLWKTRIQEFLVGDAPMRLVVTLDLLPPRGYGDVIPIPTGHMRLQVLTLDGRPAAGAKVLARDEEDTLYLEASYKTDESGRVTVDVTAKPQVIVVIFGKTLVTYEFSSKSSRVIVLPQQ